MKSIFGFMRRVWKAGAFSPSAFVARAGIIAVCYCLSELAGLREYTTFLSGTSANLNVTWQTAATLGLIHLLLYVAFILLAPVSLITAALLLLWDRWSPTNGWMGKNGICGKGVRLEWSRRERRKEQHARTRPSG